MNNGRINSQLNMNSGEQVFYYYDSLNRLTEAITSAASDQTNPPWGDTYTYDGFGNLYQKTVIKGSAPSLSVGSKYCGSYCEGSGSRPSIACNCGHGECAAGETAGAVG